MLVMKKYSSVFVLLLSVMLFPPLLSAQGLKLHVNIPKDSSSIKSKKNKYKYRLKLSLPDTVLEIKNDTLEKNGKEINILNTVTSAQRKNNRRNSVLMQIFSADNSAAPEDNNSAVLNVPLSMQGSGTSWQPESSSLPYYIFNGGNWTYYLRGSVFPRYTHQAGKRGGTKWDAPNWFMGQAQTNLGLSGQLAFRAMLSLERITEGGNGYPLLLQTGSTYRNLPLIDREHPNDFISELSATFSQEVSNNSSAFVYIGYPGEPAVGPPSFYSRQSAKYIPDAPIGLQWQDASRVSFGVVTLGMIYKNIKIEGSVFNGTRPDENRYSFDKLKLNSFGGRISYNPVSDLSFQVSAGNIKDPYNGGGSLTRTTASIIYTTKLNSGATWASSLIWGENNVSITGRQESFLSESTLDFSDYAVYARAEYVQKTNGELGIAGSFNQKDWLGEFTVGFDKELSLSNNIDLAMGIQGTFYGLPKYMSKYYGNHLASYEIYLSVQPQVL